MPQSKEYRLSRGSVGNWAGSVSTFGRTGRFNYRHAPGIVITALPSLIAGGSLGPESPLIGACGSLGTLVSDKLKLDERETRSLGYSSLSGMLAAFLISAFGGSLPGLESAMMIGRNSAAPLSAMCISAKIVVA